MAPSQQSETCFQSEASSRSFFPSVVVFLFLPPASRPTLLRQIRLDEDRPAFINHPLKRNPWRSIINDLARNLDEVPRPNETQPRSARIEIRAGSTRKTRFSYHGLAYLPRADLQPRRGLHVLRVSMQAP